ncbi:MAG: TRAP transporter substrate-binding protein [Ectothiorhodospiraceae bacterium]|nr:TRAP transporter substrate-binding protein [Ectothiorhodospiraceae bacterium]
MKKTGIATTLASAVLAGATMLGISASVVADVKPYNFKVVGTWGNLSNWIKHESNLWNNAMPAASGGKLTAQASPLTELGLKGFEVMRLLKLGVFDVAHGVVGYVAKENPEIEGVDLSTLVQDWDTMRKVVEAYKPVLAEAFEKTYGAKLMAIYPFPSQMLWCSKPVESIADLKGKKIRVYSTTLGDFVEGAGGVSTTIAFAEVVPALQKGVVDCGITGTMPAYRAKWYEVATHAYLMRVGYTATFGAINLKTWERLGPEGQAMVEAEFKKFEDNAWAETIREDEMGIICNTGVGECTEGEAGKMKKVVPSDADLAVRNTILNDFVLKRWAERCGADCVKKWNDTVGKVVGINAPTP